MRADQGSRGLMHVRFTFDRTPFRRMLRALLAVGSQTRTMRLLPPQQATPPPLSGMQLFLPVFASSHSASEHLACYIYSGTLCFWTSLDQSLP